MTLYPRDFGPGGIIRLFCFPIPCLFTSLGYIRPVLTSYTQPLHFPWVYSTCFDFLYPASSLPLGIFRLFSLLIPCLFTFPGYIWPVLTSYTQPLHFPWVYSTCFDFLYPASSLPLGIFRLFSLLIPCLFTFPGYIRPVLLSYTLPLHFPWVYSTCFHSLYPAGSLSLGIFDLFYLPAPRFLYLPGAESASFFYLHPRTQKTCLRRQHRHEAGCFLHLNSLYLNKWHFFATFTSRYPLGKLRSSCSVMPRIRISMTK